MNKAITFLLGILGINAGITCSQQNYENADVKAFAQLIQEPEVQLVDVRTIEEFTDGHLEGAVNIDVKQENFIEMAKKQLSTNKSVAVYCRSGRRSANAASLLSDIGYRVVNLKGGYIAWTDAKMPVTKENTEIDVFKTPSGKTIKFYALVHASIRINYDGKEIQIDPVSKLGNRSIDYSAMPKADYLFITHEHGDHFDKTAIDELSQNSTQIITNKRCADMLGKGFVMANGDSTRLSDVIKVEAVPAYNTTPGHTQFHPKGRDNGYILTIDGLRIYIAGDTEDIPEMSKIKDIDIAFLPCNQPYTMTTDQLINAAKIIKPKVLFPYHFSKTDVSALPTLFEKENIDVRLRHYE